MGDPGLGIAVTGRTLGDSKYLLHCLSVHRLRQELGWIGFGHLSKATWISPNDLTKEIEEIATKLKINKYIQIFQSTQLGANDPQSIVSSCWDLGRRLESGEPIKPSECFVDRFELIHEYRRFPFFDPDLPVELLPKNWLRFKAAELFHEYHNLLNERANEYFDSVIIEY